MKEKDIKGYSPAIDERRRKILWGGIQAALILVFILVIFVALNYFRILPVDKFIPQLSFLPNNEQPVSNEEYDVEVRSDDPNYTIEISNKKEILRILKEWGVYDKIYGGGYGLRGRTNNKPVKKVNVVFTTTEQPINKFVTKNKEVYMSSITDASPGNLTFTLHLGPFLLNDEELKNKWGNNFDFIFLTTVYYLVKKPTSLDEMNNPDSELNKYMKLKFDKNIELFEIKEK